MNRILQRLIKIFSKGERLKTGRVIAQDLRYASELKKLANWETTSPEVYELWSLISKEQRVAYLREMNIYSVENVSGYETDYSYMTEFAQDNSDL